MLLLSPSESADLAVWKFSWSICRAGHWRPREEVSILPLPESRGLKEGVTVGHPPLFLELTLMMKLDSPSKACSPARPKSMESNRFPVTLSEGLRKCGISFDAVTEIKPLACFHRHQTG